MWIYSLVAIAVVGCAVLAAMGFKGRVTTVGVDLGTSFSVVGFVEHGKVRIVSDELGRQIFPSVVSFQSDGKIHSLYDAQPFLVSDPHNTIYNAKRFIARNEESDEVRGYATSHPFAVEFTPASSFSDVGFRINSTGYDLPSPKKGEKSAPKLQLQAGLISPEMVGAEVLRGLMRITAAYLGHGQVSKAVIAVPAKFSPEQRAATAAAYKAVGLKVTRLVEEPTAAAIAYDLHKNPSVHHIIVYDFGGGTLDVSLLYVAKGSIQVYATDGDDALGGSDLDICLERLIGDKRCGKDVGGGEGDSSGSTAMGEVSGSCRSGHSRKLAEQVKKQLSSSRTVQVHCTEVPEEGEGGGECVHRDSFTVHREEFENTYPACRALFERSMLPLTRLLSGLNMAAADIDEVVLVGGSTRIPHVKALLRDFFGTATPLNDKIDPDVTVAYGAASIID